MDNTHYTPEEPVAAVATALAPAALGVVRTSGKNCIELVSSLFSRPSALKNAAGNTVVYGWIVTPDGKTRIDEVLVSVFRAPKSYTGEDMADISCHGGVSVVNAVYELLLANGFRPAERGEFTFRSYINGKTDLTKAEAVREIIDSRTDASRDRACGRLAGSLFAEIDSVKKLITDTLAAIEVDIEYPEDEETIADSFNPSDLELAERRLDSLAASWKSERIYQDGARVVLAGRTNAGKSSLFNVLLKEDRSIVSDIEGTTRDWIESWVSFDGVPARLFDTAGLRITDDVIEAKGVELTRELAGGADVIIYLVDASSGLSEDDISFINARKKNRKAGGDSDIPCVLVFNKCDKVSESELLELEKSVASLSVSCDSAVFISAKTGDGCGTLCAKVRELVLGSASSDRSFTGLGSERQKNSVCEALSCVRHALLIAKDGSFGLDAVVQDLEDSLDFLGEVTGEVTPDDVLGSIFENFCVGK